MLVFQPHPLEFQAMYFRGELNLLSFSLFEGQLYVGELCLFVVQISFEPGETVSQFPDAPALREKASFQRRLAASGNDAHRINHFSVWSHQSGVVAVAAPQREARVKILDQYDIIEQILGDSR